MRIIPAIDIIDGKCVRLSKGDFQTKKIYSESPLEMAKTFEDHGMKHLHLVDLDGARKGEVVHYKILEQVASKTNLNVDFGGGLKTTESAKIAFESGATQITGGSIAIKKPRVLLDWLAQYGSERIILGADVAYNRIAISGWQDTSSKEVIPFILDYRKEGFEYVVCTDISKDGMLLGPSMNLYERILTAIDGVQLIASGGVTDMEDIHGLAQLGCEGVIIGKAIYEGNIPLMDLANYIRNN